MSLRTHLASNGDGRENAIVELPECREYYSSVLAVNMDFFFNSGGFCNNG